MIAAVIFDMDGLLIDSEDVWDDVRESLARERGGTWHDGAQQAMMGMSSREWPTYMHDVIGLRESPEEINRIVVDEMIERYAAGAPWIDGAVEAVRRIAAVWPIGLASSSNRELIDAVLAEGGIDALFVATVSSEEVAAGKPSPDVYLEAARRVGVAPEDAVAIEDSPNGVRSAVAAGMRCVAIPDHRFPLGDVAAEAEVVLDALGELTPALIESLA